MFVDTEYHITHACLKFIMWPRMTCNFWLSSFYLPSVGIPVMHVTLYLYYDLLETEPRTWCMLGRHSTCWNVFLVFVSFVFLFLTYCSSAEVHFTLGKSGRNVVSFLILWNCSTFFPVWYSVGYRVFVCFLYFAEMSFFLVSSGFLS